MLKASAGGGAAPRTVYRHALVRSIIPLLGPLSATPGWGQLTIALAAVLMSLDPCPTLGQRFESALGVLDQALPRRRRTGRTYQGFVKALTRRGAAALAVVATRLRELTRETARAVWTVGELVPIGVDGSRFDAPRTIANEALGIGGRDKCGPQMMLVLLVHLGSMLPWAWKAAPVRTGERALLRDLLGLLPPRTLLVADAGYTGFELLETLTRSGVHFLVRVGRGVELLRELGSYRREGRHTVYLWPHRSRAQNPLALRLIRVGGVYLISDITDPRRLSRAAASELYRRRWGLEVAFRSLKQTLERRAVRSGTAAHALAELDWAVVGLWVLALLGARAIKAAGHSPRRLSLARALSAVRNARFRPRAEQTLRRRLRRAVQDSYCRNGRKEAYRWPHKKRMPVPGAPRITKATAAQVRLAKELRAVKAAA